MMASSLGSQAVEVEAQAGAQVEARAMETMPPAATGAAEADLPLPLEAYRPAAYRGGALAVAVEGAVSRIPRQGRNLSNSTALTVLIAAGTSA